MRVTVDTNQILIIPEGETDLAYLELRLGVAARPGQPKEAVARLVTVPAAEKGKPPILALAIQKAPTPQPEEPSVTGTS